MTGRELGIGAVSALLAAGLTYAGIRGISGKDPLKESPAGAREGSSKGSSESAARQARMEEREKELSAREKAVTAKEKELEAKEKLLAQIQPGGAAQPVSPDEAEKRKKRAKNLRKMIGLQMGAMKDRMDEQIENRYAKLLDEWGLQGEARKSVVDTLARRAGQFLDLALLILDDEVSEADILNKQEAFYAQIQAELSGFLSGAQVDQLLSGQGSMEGIGPEQRRKWKVDEVVRALKLGEGTDGAVRSALQAEDLEDWGERYFGNFFQGSQKISTDQIRAGRKILGSGFQAEIRAELKVRQEKIGDTLKPLLTPDQAELLRKHQESEAKEMEMGLQMFQMMMGGE